MAHFTKDAITDTFLELLEEKRLDKITVKDIVTKCEVSRKTFYYYFEDIYDLLEKCMSDLTMETIKNATDVESFEEGLLEIADFVMSHKKAVYHIYNSISRDQLEDYLFYSSYEPIKNIIINKTKGTHCSEKDIEVISEVCASAFTGNILRWVKNGMKADFKDVLKKISAMFEEGIIPTLRKS